MHKAHTYILLNCVEVCPFVRLFDEWIRHEEPHIEDGELDRRRELFFAKWFETHMLGSDDSNAHLKVLARGPIRYVWSHKGYFVNGYKFHTTKKWNTNKWKKSSHVAKENRKSQHDSVMSKHTGGSISMSQRRWRFVQKEGREPTTLEMFQMTHKTKRRESSGSSTGQSVISRDEKFVDDYQHEMIKYGSDTSTHPLGDIEIWERCAGGRKRGQMFGVGTSMDPSYVVTGLSSGLSTGRSYAGSSSSEVQELKEKLQKIEEERRFERENARRGEDNIRMANRLKVIEAMLARQYPPLPSDDPTSRDPPFSGRI